MPNSTLFPAYRVYPSWHVAKMPPKTGKRKAKTQELIEDSDESDSVEVRNPMAWHGSNYLS